MAETSFTGPLFFVIFDIFCPKFCEKSGRKVGQKVGFRPSMFGQIVNKL